MNRILFYILLLMLPVSLSAQEYLTGMAGNPVIGSYLENHKDQPVLKSYFLRYSPVKLPFFDNFDQPSIYPDTSLWIDKEVYINSHYPVYPVDYGVATLDVLNERGRVYEHASPFTFEADQLTSKPVRLDALFDQNGDSIRPLSPADSVYLSFYYQPQGYGDMPVSSDSIVLQFGFYEVDSLNSTDTTLVYDTIFSHYDSVWVYGYEYDMSAFDDEFLPPNSIIYPDLLNCDEIGFTLKDTLFVYDSLLIPCDSVFVLDTRWETVWSAAGDSLEVFLEEEDVFFKYVRIPVVDTKWFVDDFQFRFKTYSTISNINSWQSNTDHWHIDRVYLDAERSAADRFVRDISFVKDPPSFVNYYTGITARQYLGNIAELKKDQFPVYVSNLDSVAHDLTYDFTVETNGTVLNGFDIDPITNPMLPLFQQDVDNYVPFAQVPLKGAFTGAGDSSVYHITHVIFDADSSELADTLETKQVFSSYLSYDDGTAEAGYGLSPAQAKLAVKFNSEAEDTLWGVRLYFNRTLAGSNNRPFHLAVWNDNGGIPGDTIYAELNVRPQFTEGFNNYYDLIFSDYVRLGPVPFYVGWIQTTNHNLNIGFDKNTNSRNFNFYNVDGTWVKSSFEGSIMLRPLMGTPQGNYEKDSATVYKSTLVVRPNPPLGDQEVFIDLPAGYQDPGMKQYLILNVSDMYGRVIYKGPYTHRISTEKYKSGLYIINLFDSAYIRNFSAKLLIVK